MLNNNDNKPLSPLASNIRDAFNFSRDTGKSAMFVFWDAWGDTMFTPTVDKGAYPWAVYDEVKQRSPSAALCLAFDLTQPFNNQFPMDRFSQIETLTALSVSPVVWITDRAGKIPARERKEFEEQALKPATPTFTIIK